MKKYLIGISVLCILWLIGCSKSEGEEGNTDKKSSEADTLIIASNGNPPSMDPHMTTATITKDITSPMFETLVALDSKLEPQPMLAKSWTISDDGKVYTFILRQNVPFHNGKKLQAEDAVASLKKWIKTSSLGKSNLQEAIIEETDDYTFTISLPAKNSVLLTALANTIQYAEIMPKELIDAASEEGVKEYIGTGLFKLKEWKSDQYVLFEKFDEYASLDTPADGFAGKKEALVQQLKFQIVEDESTRVTGVQSGLYDMAIAMPFDSYERLNNDESIQVFTPNQGISMTVFNKRHGLFTDKRARQAVNYALDLDKIMVAAFSSAEFAKPSVALAPED